MDAPAPRPARLSDTLQWIEARLDTPLTLEAIAAEAGLSPWYLSRMFAAAFGLGVTAHIRRRRLARAALRLVAEPDLRLVDLAFDTGFESQEAFTRAFARQFGVPPGRFREGVPFPPRQGSSAMATTDTARVTLLPDRARRDALTIAGFSGRFDEASKATIPALWARLVPLLPFPGQRREWATYGVVYDFERETGTFRYIAGAALLPGAVPPDGFDTLELPAGTYAVFRIVLDGGPVHPQMAAAMAVIWGDLLPASGLKTTEGPDFELYDGRFTPDRPGAVIDFHMPVEG
jgi:AraC family transcriptional regulator